MLARCSSNCFWSRPVSSRTATDGTCPLHCLPRRDLVRVQRDEPTPGCPTWPGFHSGGVGTGNDRFSAPSGSEPFVPPGTGAPHREAPAAPWRKRPRVLGLPRLRTRSRTGLGTRRHHRQRRRARHRDPDLPSHRRLHDLRARREGQETNPGAERGHRRRWLRVHRQPRVQRGVPCRNQHAQGGQVPEARYGDRRRFLCLHGQRGVGDDPEGSDAHGARRLEAVEARVEDGSQDRRRS